MSAKQLIYSELFNNLAMKKYEFALCTVVIMGELMGFVKILKLKLD